MASKAMPEVCAGMGSRRLGRWLAALVVALGFTAFAPACLAQVPVASNPTPVSFASQAVGSAQAQTTVTFTVTAGGTLDTPPLVLTTGAPNLDYTLGTGSTCTGTVSAGTCTVNVVFTPKAPGQRFGAVVLTSGGATVATALLKGTGTGAAVVFPGNPTILPLGSGFSFPAGVAVDEAGNVYVGDAGNSALKEIVAVGGSIPARNPTIRPLGTGFSLPFGVAVDGAGNVYVADAVHSLVQEIIAVGGSIPANSPTIRSLGSGFNGPTGVAVDGAGNVYVGDSGNSLVKEIVAVGGSIPANDPTILPLGSGFSSPAGVAVDGAGNVYVGDQNNSLVKEISLATPPSLSFASTSVGSTSSDSPQTLLLENIGNANLMFPIPGSGANPFVSANYTLSDSSTCPQLTPSTSAAQTLAAGTCTAVISFTPVMPSTATGSLTFNDLNATNASQTVALNGTATGATGATAQTITFPQLTSPAQVGTTATLTATASSNLAITYRVVSGPATLSGETVTYTGAGMVVLEADQFGSNMFAPAAAVQQTVTVILQDSVGVPDGTQTATVTIATGGTLKTIYVLTTGQPNLDYTFVPGGTCTTGILYAVNASCTINYNFTAKAPGQRLGAVQLVANDNATILGTTLLTGMGTGAAVVFPGNPTILPLGSGFSFPAGVAVDEAGNVYVGDAGNSALKEIVAVGGSIPARNPTIRPLGTGFSLPFGVAVDGAGNVYVADAVHSLVQEIIAVGGSIPANSPTIRSLGSGFNGPTGVAVDGAGNVYVGDSGNSLVKEIVAVGGSIPANDPTILPLGSGFSSPAGVAVDGAGNVYVGDQNNSLVKEISLATPPSLSFASTSVGSTSSDSPQTLLLENIGNAALTLIPTTGTDPSISTNFVLGGSSTCPLGTTAAPGSLAPGTCTDFISFMPTTPGSISGALVLMDNSLSAGNNGVQSVLLSGMATTPVAATQAIASTTLTQNHAATAFTPVTGSGGTGTLSYRVSPTLPTGLSYSASTGAITGTPTVTSSATTYTVTVTDANNATTTATFSLTVNAAVVATQAIASTSLTVNKAATSFTPVTSSGGTGTLSYSVSPTLPTGLSYSESTGVITGTPTVTSSATTYTVTVTDANSATATATFSLTVNTPTPAIVFTIPNHSFGDAPFTVSATSNSTGAFTYSVVSGPATISGSTVTLTGAGPVVLQAAEAADANFAADSKNATFTVAAATPAIVFVVPNHTFGDAPFAVSATSNSTGAFTYSVVSGPATISGSTVTLTGAGTVVLQASEAADANFVAGTENATFTVAASTSAPAITFMVPDHTFGDTPFTVSATSNSTGAFTYSVVSGPATISGSTVTLTGAGTVVLSATEAAGGIYTTATVTTSFTVATGFSLSSGTGGSDPSTTPSGATSFSLMLSPGAGATFHDTIVFSISGLPPGATATFSPATITVGSQATAVMLSIQTSSSQARLNENPFSGSATAPVSLGFLLLPLLGLKPVRKRFRQMSHFSGLTVAVVSLGALLMGLSGCAGGSSNPPSSQPVTNYTVVVTATDTTTGVQHTTNLTFTMQ